VKVETASANGACVKELGRTNWKGKVLEYLNTGKGYKKWKSQAYCLGEYLDLRGMK
jgi:hypothetical protein